MIKYALKVFDFIRIKYPENNFGVSFYLYPVVIASLLTTLIICKQIAVSTNDIEILFLIPAFDSITTFIQVLPGFYIGSLAAISSYNREGMDNKLPTPTPYLLQQAENGIRKIELSRRTYLTLMFAYLAAITILLAIGIFFLKLFYTLKIIEVSKLLFLVIYAFNVFTMFFFFFQAIMITFVGIYYLGNRIHRNV